MTEQEMVQKIYEVIKLVDCMQYNPSVDFNYLRAKGAYNIIKNQIEHIEAENKQSKQTLSKMETVEKELKARLDKVVELKVKVGDTIYLPWQYDGVYGIATLHITSITILGTGVFYTTDFDYGDDYIYSAKYKNGIYFDTDFGDIVFTNRTEAKSRLAKLRVRNE